MHVEAQHFAAACGRLIFTVRAWSYAALSFSLWEWVITLRFETLVIWRKATDARVKRTYLGSRYLGMATEGINALVVTYVFFNPDVESSSCRTFQVFQLIVTQVLLLLFEMILLSHLYPAHSGSTSVHRLLRAALVIQVIFMTTIGGYAIIRLEYRAGGGCIPHNTPWSVMCTAATQFFAHIIICSLTLFRYFSDKSSCRSTGSRLLFVVTRDGLWVFASIGILMFAAVVDAAKEELEGTIFSITFPVYVALVSMATCRIILNIRTFDSDSSEWLSNIRSGELTVISDTFEDSIFKDGL